MENLNNLLEKQAESSINTSFSLLMFANYEHLCKILGKEEVDKEALRVKEYVEGLIKNQIYDSINLTPVQFVATVGNLLEPEFVGKSKHMGAVYGLLLSLQRVLGAAKMQKNSEGNNLTVMVSANSVLSIINSCMEEFEAFLPEEVRTVIENHPISQFKIEVFNHGQDSA